MKKIKTFSPLLTHRFANTHSLGERVPERPLHNEKTIEIENPMHVLCLTVVCLIEKRKDGCQTHHY